MLIDVDYNIYIYIYILTNVDNMFMRQLPSAWWPSSKVMLKYLGILRWENFKALQMPCLEDESPQMARYRVEHVQPQEQSGAILQQFLDQPLHNFAFKKNEQQFQKTSKRSLKNIKSQILSQKSPQKSSGFPVGFLPVKASPSQVPRPRSMDLRTPSRSMTKPKTRPKPRWFQWFQGPKFRSWADSVAIAIPNLADLSIFFLPFWCHSTAASGWKLHGCDMVWSSHHHKGGKIGTWKSGGSPDHHSRNGTWCSKSSTRSTSKNRPRTCAGKAIGSIEIASFCVRHAILIGNIAPKPSKTEPSKSLAAEPLCPSLSQTFVSFCHNLLNRWHSCVWLP